ncbi:hypothetical protein [Novosphingobium sp. 9]|uniref:hypothetical protein n=1 Tax=Novosphingobium sp. 9 TaxID=2025349 RepID=UPI0021B67BCA|nr:hypothetical protein [Novosphingobium sp. 9]
MNSAIALLFPFALLFPSAGGPVGGDVSRLVDSSSATGSAVVAGGFADGDALPMGAPQLTAFDSVAPKPSFQLRIEQRMTIRITPQSPAPIPPDRFISMPNGHVGPGYTERKIGDCLPISGIEAVRPDRDSRLLLFMRDDNIVSADLERSCRARDFYLGFYMSRTPDGRLCVGRDHLLSRSGMSCALTRIRLLVPKDP